MNTILTDEQIEDLLYPIYDGLPSLTPVTDLKVARAVEAEVLAKLARQEPVAVVGDVWMLNWVGYGPIAPIIEKHGIKIGDPLYAHPAPQQADHGVLMITTAYEQGVGKGHQARARGAEIENPYGDAVCREAWQLGYEEGKQQADRQRVPDGWREALQTARDAMAGENRIIPSAKFTAAISQLDAMLAAAPEAPAQTSAVDERAAFEAWVTNQGVALHYEGDGHYGNATVARWWEAWQARAALAQKGAA